MELISHVFILIPIILAAWAFSDGRGSERLEQLTGLSDQFTFIILGFVAFTALGIGNMMLQESHIAFAISYEMMTGTLERMFLMPVRRITILLGIGNYYIALFTFQALTLFLGAWLIFGFEPELTTRGLLFALWAVLVLVVTNVTLGIIGAALTLAFKDNQMYMLVIHRPAALVSGAYFFIDLMPQPMKFLAYINPVSYAVDAFRGALTGTPLLTDSTLIALLAASAYTVALCLLAGLVYRLDGPNGTRGKPIPFLVAIMDIQRTNRIRCRQSRSLAVSIRITLVR